MLCLASFARIRTLLVCCCLIFILPNNWFVLLGIPFWWLAIFKWFALFITFSRLIFIMRFIALLVFTGCCIFPRWLTSGWDAVFFSHTFRDSWILKHLMTIAASNRQIFFRLLFFWLDLNFVWGFFHSFGRGSILSYVYFIIIIKL